MLDFSKLNHYRENNRIEAKKAQGGLPHSIWETYSSFANTYGGIILLGVIEQADKSFASVPLESPENLVADFWSGVNSRSITNTNILSGDNVKIVESGGNRIVVIEVPRANRHDKPIYIGSDPFTGTYRRNGEGDYRCTAEEVRGMMRDRSDISQDSGMILAMHADAFAAETIQKYRQYIEKLHPGHVWSALAQDDFLYRIGALAKDEAGVPHPTAAGLLMFGHAYDIVQKYPDYFLDYQEYEQPFAESTRCSTRIVSNSGDWSGNVCDFYFRVYGRIVQSLKLPGHLTDGSSSADDAPVHLALREALANALIHADYYDRRGLVVQHWPDRIRIANPGAFRLNVQKALAGGISDPRNATMIQMFHLIHVSECAGGGLPSICLIWKTQGWASPRISEEFGPDRTTLNLPLLAEDASARSRDAKQTAVHSRSKEYKQKILEYLTDAVEAGCPEIALAIGLKPSRTRTYLAALLQDGSVEISGDSPSRKYHLKA